MYPNIDIKDWSVMSVDYSLFMRGGGGAPHEIAGIQQQVADVVGQDLSRIRHELTSDPVRGDGAALLLDPVQWAASNSTVNQGERAMTFAQVRRGVTDGRGCAVSSGVGGRELFAVNRVFERVANGIENGEPSQEKEEDNVTKPAWLIAWRRAISVRKQGWFVCEHSSDNALFVPAVKAGEALVNPPVWFSESTRTQLGARSVRAAIGGCDPMAIEVGAGHRFTQERVFIGNEALHCAPEMGLLVRYPFFRGGYFNIREGYDRQQVLGDIEAIVTHVLVDLMAIPRNELHATRVVLGIPDVVDREEWAAVVGSLLCSIGVAEVVLQREGVLSAFGTGCTTGCFVHLGATRTAIACVEDGGPLQSATQIIPMGWHDIVACMMRQLIANGSLPPSLHVLAVPHPRVVAAYWGVLFGRLCTLDILDKHTRSALITFERYSQGERDGGAVKRVLQWLSDQTAGKVSSDILDKRRVLLSLLPAFCASVDPAGTTVVSAEIRAGDEAVVASMAYFQPEALFICRLPGGDIDGGALRMDSLSLTHVIPPPMDPRFRDFLGQVDASSVSASPGAKLLRDLLLEGHGRVAAFWHSLSRGDSRQDRNMVVTRGSAVTEPWGAVHAIVMARAFYRRQKQQYPFGVGCIHGTGAEAVLGCGVRQLFGLAGSLGIVSRSGERLWVGDGSKRRRRMMRSEGVRSHGHHQSSAGVSRAPSNLGRFGHVPRKVVASAGATGSVDSKSRRRKSKQVSSSSGRLPFRFQQVDEAIASSSSSAIYGPPTAAEAGLGEPWTPSFWGSMRQELKKSIRSVASGIVRDLRSELGFAVLAGPRKSGMLDQPLCRFELLADHLIKTADGIVGGRIQEPRRIYSGKGCFGDLLGSAVAVDPGVPSGAGGGVHMPKWCPGCARSLPNSLFQSSYFPVEDIGAHLVDRGIWEDAEKGEEGGVELVLAVENESESESLSERVCCFDCLSTGRVLLGHCVNMVCIQVEAMVAAEGTSVNGGVGVAPSASGESPGPTQQRGGRKSRSTRATVLAAIPGDELVLKLRRNVTLVAAAVLCIRDVWQPVCDLQCSLDLASCQWATNQQSGG